MALSPHMKMTYIMNYHTGGPTKVNETDDRSGSASESVLCRGPGAQEADFANLLQARAAILPHGATIVANRRQQIDPSGPALLNRSRVVAGSDQLEQDTPGQALYVRFVSTATGNVRKFWIHFVPDDFIRFGVQKVPRDFLALINLYFDAMKPFCFRANKLDATKGRIDRINADGTFTLKDDPAPSFVIGDRVKIIRSTPTVLPNSNDKIKGEFKLIDYNQTLGTGTLRDWPATLTGKGGSLRKVDIIYPDFDRGYFQFIRASTRPLGRLFDPYHGRAASRK